MTDDFQLIYFFRFITQDWNMFLDNFAGHEFCLMSNHSSKLPSSGGIAQLNQSLVEGIGASEELVSITATFSIVWSSPQAMNVSFIRGNMAFQNIYPEGMGLCFSTRLVRLVWLIQVTEFMVFFYR